MTSIIIDRRYCGPPNSGNGGYVCGRLARHIPGGAEVTLRIPPPLEKPLDVVATDDGSWELRDGAAVVATGRPARVELSRLEKAGFDEACAAELLTPIKPHEHLLPTCFVCGPARAQGDGLRIFAGPLASSIPECASCARGDLDAGSQPDGGGRIGRARISLVGARLSHGLRFLLRPRERQLRPDADPVGSDVGTDRDTATPGRTLRHHCLGGRPGRPQTPCRGRGPW